MNGGNPLPAFDEQLRAAWSKALEKSAERIRNADDSAFWNAYGEYLSSPEWKEKRRKVFARASGVCEGCGESEPTQVHHISYEHVGAEFLFELVAVCDACHERLHPEQASF
jgi:5-methylcytosine-specific restriction endonuclease McrA